MIFNSLPFLLIFLPLVLSLAVILRRLGQGRHLSVFLLFVSLLFYALYQPWALPVLIFSFGLNYCVGRAIFNSDIHKTSWLMIGIAFNLLLLGFFKYTNFFGNLAVGIFGVKWAALGVAAPLGISFYTFTQLAYLIDVYAQRPVESDFKRYGLFVSFFPYISAGPILRHDEIAPQLDSKDFGVVNAERLARSLTLFTVGLFKKVIIAEAMANLVSPVFNAAAAGVKVLYWEAWIGAIAYSFQIYFDFSGYSDMALALAWAFGLNIPWNFDSPYKAVNIIDFWRRWHISLSGWLKDYLFTPINYYFMRRCSGHKFLGFSLNVIPYYLATLITMFICGFWHGAGWTFILWGLMHGAYLVINRLWLDTKKHFKIIKISKAVGSVVATPLTFLAVTWAWVIFRAPDLACAQNMWRAMAGGNGIYIPQRAMAIVRPLASLLAMKNTFIVASANCKVLKVSGGYIAFWIISAAFIIWALPNTRQWLEGGSWRPSFVWSLAIAVIGVISFTSLNTLAQFIYFKF